MEETKQHHEALIQGRDESLKSADERVAALETKLNERLEDNRPPRRPQEEDQTHDLENECSELKEKLESLLKELSKVKQENQELLVQSQAKHHQDEVERLRGEVEAHKQAIQVHPLFVYTHNFSNTVMQFFLVYQTQGIFSKFGPIFV